MFQEIPSNNRSVAKRKPIFNIGINDSPYKIEINISNKRYICPYFRVWVHMLERCYSTSFQARHPTYKGCITEKSWHTFSNFKEWMQTQDWENKDLDKDILVRGNKLYSKDTCIFVTQEINKLLLDKKKARGLLPLGIHYNKRSNKYQAQCSVFSKRVHLGYFTTLLEAQMVYIQFKQQHIINVANQQKDEKLKKALINIAYTEFKS